MALRRKRKAIICQSQAEADLVRMRWRLEDAEARQRATAAATEATAKRTALQARRATAQAAALRAERAETERREAVARRQTKALAERQADREARRDQAAVDAAAAEESQAAEMRAAFKATAAGLVVNANGFIVPWNVVEYGCYLHDKQRQSKVRFIDDAESNVPTVIAFERGGSLNDVDWCVTDWDRNFSKNHKAPKPKFDLPPVIGTATVSDEGLCIKTDDFESIVIPWNVAHEADNLKRANRWTCNRTWGGNGRPHMTRTDHDNSVIEY
jgi:hypothetical protein